MAHALSEPELLALVDALADGAWHSGEALAQAAGVSRAALAKRIERLRDWQLEVEARHGLGYRLVAPIERLEVTRLLGIDGLAVEVVPAIDSTNAQLLARDAAGDPQALFAEFQSAGRGRRGRAWQSPFGQNLYFSLAWSFASWPPQLSALPLAVGIGCARALRRAGLADVRLKWPNDLWIDGRKLGGILIEHRGEAGAGCRVVVGVGLNVAMSEAAAQAIDQPWTSVQAACAARGLAAPTRNTLARLALDELVALLRHYAAHGFAPLATEWAALDLARDQPVRVQIGERRLDGIARGVDAEGALVVESMDQRHHLHAGDVSLRLAP